MTEGEFKGKSVDEAIFNGLNALGLGLDEVDIEVIHEGGRGFLGFGKSALVRMSKRESGPKEEVNEKESSDQFDAAEAPVSEVRDETQAERRTSRPSRKERNHKKEKTVADHSDPKEVLEAETQDEEEIFSPFQGQETAEIVEDDGPATGFLNGLFEKMGVDAVCYKLSTSDNENLRLRIEGKDTAVLIGRRGDTLDALQYLTGLVVNKKRTGYVRILLDAENYREKREQTLQKLARRLAANVVRSGRTVRLEPMNPYERRILHATLQSDPKVETFSEGTDPYRRVVIRKKRATRGGDRHRQDRE